MKVIIHRNTWEEKQTTGKLFVVDGDITIYECVTLELPWKNNQKQISSIPLGTYSIRKRFSEKYKTHWLVENVPDRDHILIHKGNYYTDIKGCILVGKAFKDINKDGIVDVISSGVAMSELNEALSSSETHTLVIN